METSQKPRHWSILVSSCDTFSDLWPVFFDCLCKHLPTVPRPVHLVANFRRFDHPAVKTHCVGEDRHWADNMLKALAEIPDDLVLYLQDDFFLTAPADINALDTLADFLQQQDGVFLRLAPTNGTGRPTRLQNLYEPGRENQWIAHLQAGFWDRRKLAQMIVPGQNPWESESSLNRKAKELPGGIYSLDETAVSIMPYVEGVKGGLWQPGPAAALQAQNIQLDFSRRPCGAAGNSATSKIHRSLAKRRMRLLQRWDRWLDHLSPARRVIKPL